MLKSIMKSFVKKIFRRHGYDVVRFRGSKLGKFPYDDLTRYLRSDEPVIFDVGANEGQSIEWFQVVFPHAKIFSFEPGPSAFDVLKKKYSNKENVRLFDFGLGAHNEKGTLQENSYSNMSSLLALDDLGWGTIIRQTPIEIKTVDQVCLENEIDMLDILKIDTQGFDFEVIKGAEKTIEQNRIGLILFEVIFCNQYKGLPRFTTIMDYLIDHNFHLITFYPFAYQNKLAGWTDALFIHESYLNTNQ